MPEVLRAHLESLDIEQVRSEARQDSAEPWRWREEDFQQCLVAYAMINDAVTNALARIMVILIAEEMAGEADPAHLAELFLATRESTIIGAHGPADILTPIVRLLEPESFGRIAAHLHHLLEDHPNV
jgi:hypothetical protein